MGIIQELEEEKRYIREYLRKWRKQKRGHNVFEQLKRRLKYSHKEEFLLFGDREDFIQWYEDQKKECSYCEIPENLILKTQKLFNIRKKSIYLELDRKDNTKGYSRENIVLCCSRCNTIKSNFFTENEMKEIAIEYIKPRWENYKRMA